MAKQVPRFKEVVMNERHKETNDPLIWCRGDDDEIYVLQIDEANRDLVGLLDQQLDRLSSGKRASARHNSS